MTRQPVRIQLSRRKGFNLQAASHAVNGLPAINVARPSNWGNPFKVGEASGVFAEGAGYRGAAEVLIPAMSQNHTVEFYRDILTGFLTPEMFPHGHNWLRRFRATFFTDPTSAARAHLRGHNLACWCPLDQPCHADALLEIINEAAE